MAPGLHREVQFTHKTGYQRVSPGREVGEGGEKGGREGGGGRMSGRKPRGDEPEPIGTTYRIAKSHSKPSKGQCGSVSPPHRSKSPLD